MRNILLLALALLITGCTTTPRTTTDIARWQVIPLNSAEQPSGNVAILLDSQTGDTWMNATGTNNWAKMSK
jgi:hypothetical protein